MKIPVDVDEVVAAGQRLADFISAHYPGFQVFREWLMKYQNRKVQLQGWIDPLLETADVYGDDTN